jgi:integral membrane sensor domain MASE1
VLAAYAAGLPLQSGGPLFIWPAHGLALGTLLVAPARRWPVYLGHPARRLPPVGRAARLRWSAIMGLAAINLATPLVIAFGLLKLAGPRVEIGTLRGLASFLIGMVPLVALMAMFDSAYSYVRFDLSLRQQWSVHFFSTTIGMLIVSPAVLSWSRRGYRQAIEMARERWPELAVLFVFLVIITNYVFKTPSGATGFIPPAYLCAPFLIWAALRFGLRAASLGPRGLRASSATGTPAMAWGRSRWTGSRTCARS